MTKNFTTTDSVDLDDPKNTFTPTKIQISDGARSTMSQLYGLISRSMLYLIVSNIIHDQMNILFVHCA